jgi:cell division protein FtsB
LNEIKAARQQLVQEQINKNQIQTHMDRLVQENATLKEQLKYLEHKITQLINERIKEKLKSNSELNQPHFIHKDII